MADYYVDGNGLMQKDELDSIMIPNADYKSNISMQAGTIYTPGLIVYTPGMEHAWQMKADGTWAEMW